MSRNVRVFEFEWKANRSIDWCDLWRRFVVFCNYYDDNRISTFNVGATMTPTPQCLCEQCKMMVQQCKERGSTTSTEQVLGELCKKNLSDLTVDEIAALDKLYTHFKREAEHRVQREGYNDGRVVGVEQVLDMLIKKVNEKIVANPPPIEFVWELAKTIGEIKSELRAQRGREQG